MKRCIVLAIVLGILLIIGGGCVGINLSKDESRNINEVALAYMEQKYGEKFNYVAPWGNSMTGTYQLLVSCESLPEQKITVQVENYKQADRVFRDNYLTVKYRQEIIDFIDENASSELDSVIVYYHMFNDGLSEGLSADASFSDFLTDPCLLVSATVETKASNFLSKEQVQNIAKLIGDSIKNYWLTVIFVADDQFGSFDEKTLGVVVARNEFVRCAQIRCTDGNIEIDWQGEERWDMSTYDVASASSYYWTRYLHMPDTYGRILGLPQRTLFFVLLTK